MVKLPPGTPGATTGVWGDLGYMKKPPVEGGSKWKKTIRTAVQEKTTEPMSGAKIRNIIGIAKHFCKKSFCPYIVYVIPM